MPFGIRIEFAESGPELTRFYHSISFRASDVPRAELPYFRGFIKNPIYAPDVLSTRYLCFDPILGKPPKAVGDTFRCPGYMPKFGNLSAEADFKITKLSDTEMAVKSIGVYSHRIKLPVELSSSWTFPLSEEDIIARLAVELGIGKLPKFLRKFGIQTEITPEEFNTIVEALKSKILSAFRNSSELRS